MYAYDELDRTLINERVSEFRDQVKRRLSGELTEDEFKMLRLQNGVYLQLHAYMFRVAIPYGTLSSKQLRALAHVARRYDRGYGHFTTRQNIQFNWIKLAELPDALADLAEVGIHGIPKEGQEIAARNSYRPRNSEIAREYEKSFAKVELFTIDDVFGGWAKAQKEHFAEGAHSTRSYKN